MPQVAQDISLLVNFSSLNGFEASGSFHGKAGKLDLGLGWGINIWSFSWESTLLDAGNVPISALSSNPKPIVHGRTFLMLLYSLVSRRLELPTGFNRKKRWLACFILQSKDKMQVRALYILDAKAVSSEEVEGGTRKPSLNFCSSRLRRMWLEKNGKKHLQTEKV